MIILYHQCVLCRVIRITMHECNCDDDNASKYEWNGACSKWAVRVCLAIIHVVASPSYVCTVQHSPSYACHLKLCVAL